MNTSAYKAIQGQLSVLLKASELAGYQSLVPQVSHFASAPETLSTQALLGFTEEIERFERDAASRQREEELATTRAIILQTQVCSLSVQAAILLATGEAGYHNVLSRKQALELEMSVTVGHLQHEHHWLASTAKRDALGAIHNLSYWVLQIK